MADEGLALQRGLLAGATGEAHGGDRRVLEAIRCHAVGRLPRSVEPPPGRDWDPGHERNLEQASD
jgi:hypothetical protein